MRAELDEQRRSDDLLYIARCMWNDVIDMMTLNEALWTRKAPYYLGANQEVPCSMAHSGEQGFTTNAINFRHTW